MQYADPYIVVTAQVVYVLVRVIIVHCSSFTWNHWVGLILTSLAYAISYKQLDNLAKPTYSDDDELIDGGFDMSTGGVCGYGLLLPSFLLSNPLVFLVPVEANTQWW